MHNGVTTRPRKIELFCGLNMTNMCSHYNTLTYTHHILYEFRLFNNQHPPPHLNSCQQHYWWWATLISQLDVNSGYLMWDLRIFLIKIKMTHFLWSWIHLEHAECNILCYCEYIIVFNYFMPQIIVYSADK